MDRLEAEHDNLRAALGWAVDRSDGAMALRLGSALWAFWAPRGHQAEGRAWLERALDVGEMAPPAVRAKALARLGNLAVDLDDFRAARAHFEASLALRRQLGDQRGVADSLNNLGAAATAQGTDPLHAFTTRRLWPSGGNSGTSEASPARCATLESSLATKATLGVPGICIGDPWPPGRHLETPTSWHTSSCTLGSLPARGRVRRRHPPGRARTDTLPGGRR